MFDAEIRKAKLIATAAAMAGVAAVAGFSILMFEHDLMIAGAFSSFMAGLLVGVVIDRFVG